jgi:hypothetical protein
MRFTVDIPGQEPSQIEVSRNWLTGSFRILADGKVIAERSPWTLFTHFTRPLCKLPMRIYRYEFPVGRAKQHHVVVEHTLPLFLAGLRPQTFRVFVDGRLIHEQTGY